METWEQPITQLDPIVWNLPYYRFLNEERIELPDIDVDVSPEKRPIIIKKIKEERQKYFYPEIDALSKENLGCTGVATFGTLTTKAVIQTACRGYRSEEYPMGIDVDVAQYISSLIPAERGFLWSLNDVIKGNPEKGRKPVQTFLNEIKKYPGFIDILLNINGLITQLGSHASGFIFFEDDPYEKGCFMTTPGGEIITQWDLHDSEWAGMVKYDFLVTDAQTKISEAISLLQKDGLIESDLSLREVYDKYLHPSVLDIEDQEIWTNISNGGVLNLFQFESQVGSVALSKIQPRTILEMSDANSLMRLMGEPGAETPLDKYVRFKNNINLWYDEMNQAGLTGPEQEVLEKHFARSYGVPPTQEQLMEMLMDEDICGFTLGEANSARKIVGKKIMAEIPNLKEKIYQKAKSKRLADYVWANGVSPQLGYAFSLIHSLAYSFVAYQMAYLATKFNPIYWNTACLIVNSNSTEVDTLEDDDEESKKKNVNYVKTAVALNEIISANINVSLVDINHSDYTFKPDTKNNTILFGMKALSGVNADHIKSIIAGRPYTGIKDFMNRVKLPAPAMVSLIKSGAFDNLEKEWCESLGIEPRKAAMVYFIKQISNPKKRITMQNFNGLIQANLIPKELKFEQQIFNLNKILKSLKYKEYYILDGNIYDFFIKYFEDKIDMVVIDGKPMISQSQWKKKYDEIMANAKAWINSNKDVLLENLNKQLFIDKWNEKEVGGTLSEWEMKSVYFYHHPHELINVRKELYDIDDFENLPSEPQVVSMFGKYPIYKLSRIIGTVIGKNDARATISLLTTGGVVNVKFPKEYYAIYKKQISEVQPDGTKKVMEKGWFRRGVKLLINGYRRDDMFISKKYKNSNSHQLYQILEVKDDGKLVLTNERYGGENGEV